MIESRVITQAVARDWQRGYALAADPLQLPRWASGLAASTLTRIGDHWRVGTPEQGPAMPSDRAAGSAPN